MRIAALLLMPAVLLSLVVGCAEEGAPGPSSSDDMTPKAAEVKPVLQAKLDAKKSQWAERADETTKTVYDQGIAKVKASGVLGTMKNVGDQAPGFRLPDASGVPVSLEQLLADGPVIVVFYRGAWCPYCNLTLAAWQDRLEEVRSLGGQVVAISPQMPDFSLSAKEKSKLAFPVLSDVGNEVADAFGVTTKVTPEILNLWEGRIDLEKHNGDDSAELPLPATYLIDRDGTIRYAHAHEDYRVRAEPAAVIAALEKLKK